ncbi:MAG: hypothetical protein IT581_11745 [Verrucomicrobiales bacterium]|nr:hypothetical protein [Verrucomicrobiales bacterium]
MTPWTPTARQELESILDDLRPTLTESGADPDEVLDDLRRHIAEEAAVARLTIVTEADVRRLVERVAPTPRLEDLGRRHRRGVAPAPFAPPEPPAPKVPEIPTATKPPALSGPRSSGRVDIKTTFLWIFGVVLPVITLVYELATGHCAAEFFDPLPSVWHGLMVAAVPLANAWVLRKTRVLDESRERTAAKHRRSQGLWAANGLALAVSSAYALLFLPLMPAAMLAVVVFLGVFALAPMGAWLASLALRFRLSKESGSGSGSETPLGKRAWWLGFAATSLAMIALALPQALTRHYARVAAEDSGRSADALRWLRQHGNRDQLLGDCYGRRPGVWPRLMAGNPDPETARRVFFQVTGQPFNAVPAPKSIGSRRMTGFASNFEWNGADWDAGIGGETVAGLVRGLSLASSRLDAVCDPEAAWSYTEWTLEFRNDHSDWQREARAQIQLPPGGVVSRLTLWVQGEEREAAFASRGDTRDAYHKVAVVQRRDPVLVTTSGPDRVLLQCFPVEPRGGTMKVRVGITAPMVLTATTRAVLTWPIFAERNFGVDRDLRHTTWVESATRPVEMRDGWKEATGHEGRVALRGEFHDAPFSDGTPSLHFTRHDDITDCWSFSRAESEGAWVHAHFQSTQPEAPSRLALVLDGSVSMRDHFPAIATAVGRLSTSIPIAVFLAKDGVQRLVTNSDPATVARAIADCVGEGGQDDVPALNAAWEWASGVPRGRVLWIHGPHPMTLTSTESLRQRLDWGRPESDPILWDFPIRPGPNRVAEALDGKPALKSVARIGSLADDLARLLATWGEPALTASYRLASASSSTMARDPRWHQTAGHLARLWASSEVQRLGRERQKTEATTLAARHQLVTSASGAVVLENRTQFTQAGLTPVDPATVPVVPEPAPIHLVLLALALSCLRRTPRHRRRRFESLSGLGRP